MMRETCEVNLMDGIRMKNLMMLDYKEAIAMARNMWVCIGY